MKERSPAHGARRARVAILLLTATVGVLLVLAQGRRDLETDRFRAGVDGPMVIGLAWQWEHGTVAVRDFAWEKGPGTQWLAWLGAKGSSSPAWERSEPSIYLLFRLLGCLGLVLALWRMPLPPVPLAALSVAAIAVEIERSWSSHRAFLAMLVAGALGSFLFAKDRSRTGAAVAVFGLVSCELLSFDFAIFLSVAVVAACAVETWLSRRGAQRPERPTCWLRLALLFCVAGSANVLLALASGCAPGAGEDGCPASIWRSLGTVSAYWQTMGTPWQLGWLPSLILGLSLLLLTGLILAAVRERGATSERGVVLVLAFVALFALRGATLRSDRGHVALALVPSVLLLGHVWPGPGSRRRMCAVWWATGLGLVIAWPTTFLADRPLGAPVLPGLRPLSDLRAILAGRTYGPPLEELRAQRPEFRGPVVSLPFDGRVGPIVGAPLVTPYHQLYAARTVDQQREYVRQLDALEPTARVVLALDELAAWRFDGGQNMTRTPIVYEHLMRRYEATHDGLLDDGRLILRARDDERNLVTKSLEPVPRRRDGATVATLGETQRCSLLRVGVSLRYPPTAFVGWPSALAVTVVDVKGRETRSRLACLDLDHPFWTLIDLSDAEQAGDFYRRGAWPPGREVREIRLVPETGGPFGVRPATVELRSVECLQPEDRAGR